MYKRSKTQESNMDPEDFDNQEQQEDQDTDTRAFVETLLRLISALVDAGEDATVSVNGVPITTFIPLPKTTEDTVVDLSQYKSNGQGN